MEIKSERKTIKGNRILDKEEKIILKKIISDIQRPKHWRDKRLLG